MTSDKKPADDFDGPWKRALERFLEAALEKGIEKGMEKGMEKGRLESKRESVLQVLEARFGAVPEEVQSALSAIEDLKRLETLTRTAATMPDMDTFAQALAAD